MDLQEAKTLTYELMREHGLTYDGWTFKWHHAKTIFGTCYHRRREIALSKKLTEKLPVEEVKDTILHEIAHALVGKGHGHNHIWKNQARAIGCRANRCKSIEVDVQPKYKAKCKGCGKTHVAHRRPKRSHWCRCNGRRFDPAMKLVYVQQY